MLLGMALDTAKISHPSRRVDLTDPGKPGRPPVDNSVDNFIRTFTYSTKKSLKVCKKNYAKRVINVLGL